MTHEQLEAIRERAEETSFTKAYVKGDPWKGYEVRNEGNGMVIAEASCGTDAEFIANAREDIPTLLAEVDRLRAKLTDATSICLWSARRIHPTYKRYMYDWIDELTGEKSERL